MNPFEQVISKIKRKLRDAKQRTVNDLWSYFSNVFNHCNENECRSYLYHSSNRYS